MAIIVLDASTPPSSTPPGPGYASVVDVRERYTGSATDSQIQAAIDYATALVTARARRMWNAGTAQVTVFDVRGDTIVLDIPFTDITEVELDGLVLGSESYEILPFGVRLLWAHQRRWNGRGATAKITALFDNSVPELIKEATLLLVLDRLAQLFPETGSGEGGGVVLPELPASVRSFSVEGLSVTFGTGSDGTIIGAEKPSTGNLGSDRLIDLVVRTNRVGVV